MTFPVMSYDNAVNEGLEYILSHFRHQMHLWPRTISTKTIEGRQVVVYSKEEAIAKFKQANFMDSSISGYPYWRPSITSDFAEIKNAIAPNFVMIDLDIYMYYALTEAGLYQLFLRNKKPSFILRFSWIIDNYGDCAIFDTFLYSYFNKQTLTSIRQPSKTLKIYEIFEDVNFKVLHFIVEYLHVCCRELYSGLKKDYTSNKENHMAYLNSYIHTIVNEFLFNLVLAFGYYEQDIGLSILKTFSQDDKFMGEVENVHERFQRSYKIAMDLRKRS